MADSQAHGVVGIYSEPETTMKKPAMKNTATYRPMPQYIVILYCCLAAFVGTWFFREVLLYFGWENWATANKSVWQPDWNTLPVSIGCSWVTSFVIGRMEQRRRAKP